MTKAPVETAATKAPVGKPPSKKADEFKLLATIADTAEKPFVADNMKVKKVYKDLNFKVDAKFSREFKMTATSRGMSMKELLEDCFAAWKAAQK